MLQINRITQGGQSASATSSVSIRILMLHPSSALLTQKCKFTSTNQNLFRWMLGASRGIVSILMRICRFAKLAGMLRHVALIDRLLHQLRVSEGKITHLCKEH